MASNPRCCVFVGNIPYDATEEQLVDICREVGPVVSFRLVIDRETGKPRGYGFCEYKDEETALSARRNLHGYEINGRQLRVDFAENDKNADKNREQGRGGPGLADPQKQAGGPAIIGESSHHQPIGLHIALTAATVMAGALGGVQTGMQSNLNGLQNQSALVSDPLTLHLAKMSRSQLNDIMSELKVMATQNGEQARQLLLARPHLPKALFQAQIMLGIVTPQVLQMPNIRQPPGQPVGRPLQETHQGQKPAVQTLPGLPSIAQRMPSSLAPKMQEVEFSSASQKSLVQNQFSLPPQQIQHRSQIPLHPNTNIPRPVILPGQSGVPPITPVLSVRPQIQVANSLSLNQKIPPSLLQHMGQQVGTANFGRSSQMALPNVAMESTILPRPLTSDAAFQHGPSKSSGISEAANVGDRSIRHPDNTVQIHRNNAYVDMQTNIFNGSKEPTSRPTKLLKLDEGKRMTFPPSALNVSKSGPAQAFAVSSVPASAPKQEELQNSEKQGSRLPPDVESVLLEQVMNLTPEQLNSLPLEQRLQVMQLQQALRRDQTQPS